jgi:hypothetical protein
MTAPRRNNEFLSERVVISYDHAQVTADTTLQVHKASRALVIDKAYYVSEIGLAAHATNFFNIKLENATGSVLAANWSTETGEEGTIAAATFVELDLSTVAGALTLAAGDVLELILDEGGTATLEPGRIQIEGRYI